MVGEALPCLAHHLLLFLLLAGATSRIDCIWERKVLSSDPSQWRKGGLHRPALLLRSRREKEAVVLEMRHHSFNMKLISNQEDRLQMILMSDEARTTSLLTRMRDISREKQEGSFQVQIPLTSGAKLQTLNYIVAVEIGSAKLTLITDTGSDLTWVQCKPCASCYNQQDPLFDPSKSASYRQVPCNSSVCNLFQLTSGVLSTCGWNQPNCYYAVNYGDGSFTRGVLAREQINLAGTIANGFVFGCGRNNRGLFGGTSGLMGLGRNKLSLVSQTLTQFGGVFSYCLPTKEFESSGSLVLGNDYSSYRNSTPVVYTRMISDPVQTPFYFLNVTGMRIGGVALQASGFSSSKIIIDSGTVITRLVPSIYKAVKDEFLKQFAQYPMAPGFSILDTCFDLSSNKEVNIPAVKLEFEGGASVEVDASGVFYSVKSDASQVCLAFSGLSYEDEVAIIGNYQQKNLRVVYDTIGSRLGFAQEICGYS